MGETPKANVPIFVLIKQGLRATLEVEGLGISNQFFEYLDLVRNFGPEHGKST